LRSPEADNVEAYMRGEAAKLADIKPEDFVTGLRQTVERIFEGWEDKPEAMLSVLNMEADCTAMPVLVGDMLCEWIYHKHSDLNSRLLYVHGGGGLAGSTSTHRALASRIAAQSGCVILNVGYRLAPEHPFPAAIDDCVTAANWLTSNSPEGKTESAHLFMAGDSAGGGLVLSALLNRRNDFKKFPSAVATLSALTDFSGQSKSMTANLETDALLSAPAIMAAGALYGGEVDPLLPELSPLNAMIENLPPLLMQASSSEVLFDDSKTFIEKHLASGGIGELSDFPGMVHVWHGFAPYLPEANRAISELSRFIARYRS
jgi:monoterpene epsilon-lactone hydrolase